MDLEKIFIFFCWFLLCCLACSYIGLLIVGVVLGLYFLLQYNIFMGLGAVIGAVIGVASLAMAFVIMKED